jgi:hypothetical protein
MALFVDSRGKELEVVEHSNSHGLTDRQVPVPVCVVMVRARLLSVWLVANDMTFFSPLFPANDGFVKAEFVRNRHTQFRLRKLNNNASE